jgi:predicted lipid-binding transport protein (Tim44 family)
VGGQTAERIAADLDSGLLVVLVPEWTERAKDGTERAGDPLSSRIVFATPELPERVDAAWIEAEQRKAADAGIAPRARAAGEPDPLRVEARDRDALGRFLADILERYAPGESDRIRDLRATS